MQAINVVATLAGLDGSEEDLDKVLAIEAVAGRLRKEKQDTGKDDT